MTLVVPMYYMYHLNLYKCVKHFVYVCIYIWQVSLKICDTFEEGTHTVLIVILKVLYWNICPQRFYYAKKELQNSRLFFEKKNVD